MNNNQGRTSTIFIILIAVLLISSTAIGFFMYQKENEKSRDLQDQLIESKKQEEKLNVDLKDAKKQITLLQDKNKEADAKINNLMDEIELNEGLRNELKKENSSLKEAIESAKKEKEALKAELENYSTKMQQGQEQLKVEQAKVKDLLAKLRGYDHTMGSYDDYSDLRSADEKSFNPEELASSQGDNFSLDRIVVGKKNKGKVLSIDKESDFLICNLGATDGVKVGDYLAVYKDEEYLGDVKVSRVQDEMSAADFVAPLSNRKVHRNDLVVLKS